MTLLEWAAAERQRINDFIVNWTEANKANGDTMYPMEMPPGEWDEQFRAAEE